MIQSTNEFYANAIMDPEKPDEIVSVVNNQGIIVKKQQVVQLLKLTSRGGPPSKYKELKPFAEQYWELWRKPDTKESFSFTVARN